jgi:hypothetical protein
LIIAATALKKVLSSPKTSPSFRESKWIVDRAADAFCKKNGSKILA